MPEPKIRPRSFRSYWGQKNPYTSSYSYALPGSGSYTSVSRGYNQKSTSNAFNQKSTANAFNQKSTANAFNQKYPGNQNPRQYGPISQRIKNYGPYKIQYLQGKSKVILLLRDMVVKFEIV